MRVWEVSPCITRLVTVARMRSVSLSSIPPSSVTVRSAGVTSDCFRIRSNVHRRVAITGGSQVSSTVRPSMFSFESLGSRSSPTTGTLAWCVAKETTFASETMSWIWSDIDHQERGTIGQTVTRRDRHRRWHALHVFDGVGVYRNWCAAHPCSRIEVVDREVQHITARDLLRDHRVDHRCPGEEREVHTRHAAQLLHDHIAAL